jgi:mannose/fructose/N-acetylgalactosamine-specific phosphotransferase system component IIC
MNAPAPYFHWGFILISMPNLVLIGVMVLLFVAALVAPFPGHGKNEEESHDQ